MPWTKTKPADLQLGVRRLFLVASAMLTVAGIVVLGACAGVALVGAYAFWNVFGFVICSLTIAAGAVPLGVKSVEFLAKWDDYPTGYYHGESPYEQKFGTVLTVGAFVLTVATALAFLAMAGLTLIGVMHP